MVQGSEGALRCYPVRSTEVHFKSLVFSKTVWRFLELVKIFEMNVHTR